jgi:hypothetical protein
MILDIMTIIPFDSNICRIWFHDHSWDRMEYSGRSMHIPILCPSTGRSSAAPHGASLAPDMKPAPSAPKRSPAGLKDASFPMGKPRRYHSDSMGISWYDDMIWCDMIYIYTYDYYININSSNDNWWGLLDPHQAIPLPIFFFYSLLIFPLCFSILLNQFSSRHQAARRCFASFTAIGCPSGLWAWMLSWELLGQAATDSRKMKQLHMYEHATALNVMVGGMSHQHNNNNNSNSNNNYIYIIIW